MDIGIEDPWLHSYYLRELGVINQFEGRYVVALLMKNPPANGWEVRGMCSISRPGRSPGGGHSNLLQYSCLENPMDREVWWLWSLWTDWGSQTWLKRLSTVHVLTTIPPTLHWLASLSLSFLVFKTCVIKPILQSCWEDFITKYWQAVGTQTLFPSPSFPPLFKLLDSGHLFFL